MPHTRGVELRWRAGTGLWLASAALAALVAFAILAAGDGVEGRPVSSDDLVTALAIGGALFAGWVVFGAFAAYLAGRAVRQGRGAAAAGTYATIPVPGAGAVGATAGAHLGGDRFGTFADEARRVLALAQDEAQRFDHSYIGTEHLLLGILREQHCLAAQVLARMGVELAKARTAVEFIIGRGDGPAAREVGLTPRAKRVVELAVDEARRLGHHDVNTGHLLLGLVREGEGIAAGVLESLGVNLDRVRHEVVRALRTDSPGESADT